MTTILLLAVSLLMQQAPALTAAERAIAAAEKAATSFPFLGRTAPVRTCTFVKPDQIAFPSSTGPASSYNLSSGEFTAGSISFGWDKTYEQAKMPLYPKHPTSLGNGLRMVVTRIESGAEQYVQTYQPLSNHTFATWPKFPSPGRWMIVMAAGVNWGCFVLDRPVPAK